jgi:hypothetical protein
MPRVIAALAIATTLIFGVFIIKNKSSAMASPTALVAEEIQNANQSSIAAYGATLEADGVASDTTVTLPPTISSTATDTPLGPLTATDELAQTILETYVNTKESGVDISTDTASQIADNLNSQSYTGSDAPKTYSLKDFAIESTNSAAALKDYSAALSSAISIPLAPNQRYELDIFEDFANSNDASILAPLSLNIARYQKIISQLLAMPVPKSLMEEHVILTNSLSAMVFDIQKMQSFPTDPVGGLNAVSDYTTASQDMTAALVDQINLIASHDIEFSAGN